MPHTQRPTFFDLDPSEALAILRRHDVGRLAFAFHDRVDIEPISYQFADGWVYARTSPGTKLTTVQHHPWVAFEVDEVVGHLDWRSVVVHGTIYFLDPNGGDRDRESYAAALDLLRAADDASALMPGDPTPRRTVLFRIHADEIIGRGARMG